MGNFCSSRDSHDERPKPQNHPTVMQAVVTQARFDGTFCVDDPVIKDIDPSRLEVSFQPITMWPDLEADQRGGWMIVMRSAPPQGFPAPHSDRAYDAGGDTNGADAQSEALWLLGPLPFNLMFPAAHIHRKNRRLPGVSCRRLSFNPVILSTPESIEIEKLLYHLDNGLIAEPPITCEGETVCLNFNCEDFIGAFAIRPPSVPWFLPAPASRLVGQMNHMRASLVLTARGWELEKSLKLDGGDLLQRLCLWPIIFPTSMEEAPETRWVVSISDTASIDTWSYQSARIPVRSRAPMWIDSQVLRNDVKGATISIRVHWEEEDLGFTMSGVWDVADDH